VSLNGDSLRKGDFQVRMHIVLCSREFPGVNLSGGIGVYTQEEARVLVDQGHEVTVITEGSEADMRTHPHGYRLILITPVEGFKTDAHGYSYQLYKTLRQMTRHTPIDVIEFPEYQGEGYFTIKAKRLLGQFAETTLVVHSHMSLEFCDQLNEEFPTLYRQAIFNIERYALRYADQATVPCDALAEVYQSFVPREYRRKWHPMPRFDRSLPARRNPSGDPTVLYVGRMEHRKGVDLLVASAVRLLETGRSFRVKLIGGDTFQRGVSYRSQLLKMIPEKWRDRFEFVGPVKRDQLIEEYQRATVCVFPSRFENWPNVCLEAMSYGKAIIASERGGMREMLDNGAGILVDPENPTALDGALERLFDRPDVAQELGQKARERFEAFERQEPFDYRTLKSGQNPASTRADADWPQVSIVVPCYNAAGTIERTVKNLERLDYPHYEIILVDDGSTDAHFAQLLDRLAQKSDRIRVYHKTNSGLPGARNYGARRAQGEYLVFCDADDLLHPWVLREAVAALQRYPELAAVYPILRYFGDMRGLWGPQDLYLPTILAENQTHAGLVIRRAVFDTLSGYDETFVFGWEDWEFAVRMAKAGYAAEVLPREGYFYRVHPTSMVRTTSYERRVTMYRQLWRKHTDLLGPSGVYVLDRELTLPRGYNGEPHQVWLRERLLKTAPARFVLFVARYVPKPIKSPIRRLVKNVVLRLMN